MAHSSVDLWHGPPPACKKQGCIFASKYKDSYCDELHRSKAGGVGCKAIRVDGYLFCEQHVCRAPTSQDPLTICAKEVITGGQWCADHACRRCLSVGTHPVGSAMPNSFYCQAHRCRAPANGPDRRQCPALRCEPYDYCVDHCCPACYQVLPDDPRAVQHRVGGRALCGTHTCVIKDCLRPRFTGSKHPVEHLYRLWPPSSPSPVDPAYPDVRLCVNHRCQAAGVEGDTMCGRPRVQGSNCTMHACRVCVFNRPDCIKEAVQELPRNVCPDHKLCSFEARNGAPCYRLAMDGGLTLLTWY
jgi:hypothetical protein